VLISPSLPISCIQPSETTGIAEQHVWLESLSDRDLEQCSAGQGLSLNPSRTVDCRNDALTFEPHHLWRVRDGVYDSLLF
jgi:hypothetical protein